MHDAIRTREMKEAKIDGYAEDGPAVGQVTMVVSRFMFDELMRLCRNGNQRRAAVR
jgi:hypothetical protein